MIVPNVSCVAIDDSAIIISGEPGAGKSSLALALIDRGGVLVGDDGVTLERANDTLIASPPPNISGLLEVRNVGLIRLPSTTAPLALWLDLAANAPRLPDNPQTRELIGLPIPQISLYPETPALPLRAQWALRQHGLV